MAGIGVVGAGSWGTTLANHLALKGMEVDLWVWEKRVFQQIRDKRVNETFLPGIRLSDRIRPVQSFKEVARGKEVIVLAVPSHVFGNTLTKLSPFLASSASLVAGTKGIEPETLMTMSQVVASQLPGREFDRYACLSGPSFAREVCEKHPTAVSLASRSRELAKDLQAFFSTDYFRVYTTHDVLGVELAGALKNVIAIAAGVSDGLRFGYNTRAALITRGSVEIARLGVALGAEQLTFAGLAGIGDLILTCTGHLSRNRMVGLEIAKGIPVKNIVSGMKMVAEGVNTSVAAYRLAQRMGVEMPITTEVYRIIYERKDPLEAVRDLMTRELKVELET
jgi:glycerol-3-phosphate dehydrogenase (NAD(P)+)